MKKILLGHGKLQTLADKTGVTPATCSKYLRGLYDDEKPEVKASAESVRKLALQMGGVEEK